MLLLFFLDKVSIFFISFENLDFVFIIYTRLCVIFLGVLQFLIFITLVLFHSFGFSNFLLYLALCYYFFFYIGFAISSLAFIAFGFLISFYLYLGYLLYLDWNFLISFFILGILYFAGISIFLCFGYMTLIFDFVYCIFLFQFHFFYFYCTWEFF